MHTVPLEPDWSLILIPEEGDPEGKSDTIGATSSFPDHLSSVSDSASSTGESQRCVINMHFRSKMTHFVYPGERRPVPQGSLPTHGRVETGWMLQS